MSKPTLPQSMSPQSSPSTPSSSKPIGKLFYRREPISSFLLTLGAVDMVLGGLDDRWVLFSLGLSTVGLAIGVRLLRLTPLLDKT
jgi:hypothetical protein